MSVRGLFDNFVLIPWRGGEASGLYHSKNRYVFKHLRMKNIDCFLSKSLRCNKDVTTLDFPPWRIVFVFIRATCLRSPFTASVC